MTLAKKAEKEYLAITPAADGFTILAEPRHATDLQALFQQYHIPCRRQPGAQPDRDALRFDASANRGEVERLLDEYKRAKGS